MSQSSYLDDLIASLAGEEKEKEGTFAEGLIESVYRRVLTGMHDFVQSFHQFMPVPGVEGVINLTRYPGDKNSFLVAFMDRSAIRIQLSTITPDELEILAKKEEVNDNE